MALATYMCATGQWTPLRPDLAPVPFIPPEPPVDPGPNPGDLGTVGNRPALTVAPTAADTGPRQPTTTSMSGSEALAAILAAPVEADGRRYLRRAAVGSIDLSGNQHTDLVFEDCTFATGGNYCIDAFQSGTEPTAGEWPEFRYCEISGGTSASVIGSHARFLRCNIHFGVDIVKPFGPAEFYGNYLHGNNHPSGAHCDTFQIVTGAADLLIHWNNCQNFNALESESSAGQQGNGVLQTGTVTGNIGPVQWLNNWFDGGGYTIRCGGNRQGHTVDYTFRNNRFGRNSRYGPLVAMSGIDFDSTNIWDDTGDPVTGG